MMKWFSIVDFAKELEISRNTFKKYYLENIPPQRKKAIACIEHMKLLNRQFNKCKMVSLLKTHNKHTVQTIGSFCYIYQWFMLSFHYPPSPPIFINKTNNLALLVLFFHIISIFLILIPPAID